MDPITALGIAGNVVQFIDFGIKMTAKTREIKKSAQGATFENETLEALTKHLAELSSKLEASVNPIGESEALCELCEKCAKTCKKLLAALEEVKFKKGGNEKSWKKIRKAFKLVLGRNEREEMRKELEGYREEFSLRIQVELRNQQEVLEIRNTSRYDELDSTGKAVLEAIEDHRNYFNQAFLAQDMSIREQHRETRAAIKTEGRENRLEVISALARSQESFLSSHQELQESDLMILNAIEEVGSKVKTMEEQLRDNNAALQESNERLRQVELQTQQRELMHGTLITAFNHTQNRKRRRKLLERINAATAAIYALKIIYQSLKTLIMALRARAATLMFATTSSFSQMWESQSAATTTMDAPTGQINLNSTELPTALPPPESDPVVTALQVAHLGRSSIRVKVTARQEFDSAQRIRVMQFSYEYY